MNDESLKPVDVKGSNLEEAINNGLAQLGLSRNEVIIEIIEEGGGGFLGMGAKEALVRLIPLRAPSPPVKQVTAAPVREEEIEAPVWKAAPTPASVEKIEDEDIREETSFSITAEPEQFDDEDEYDESDELEQFDDDEEYKENDETEDNEVDVEDVDVSDRYDPDIDFKREADIARATLKELLDQMDVQAEIAAYPSATSRKGDNTDVPWVLNIQGQDLGILIGRRGETLNALQYVTRLIVSRELQQRTSFMVDVEGYKTRREETLRSLAQRMASRAKSQGRTMALEPMPPNERRIIHLALRGDRSVKTESVGTGDRRKVTIIPNNGQN